MRDVRTGDGLDHQGALPVVGLVAPVRRVMARGHHARGVIDADAANRYVSDALATQFASRQVHRVDPEMILVIDPGTTESAFVRYDVASRTLRSHGKVPNLEMLEAVKREPIGSDLAIEMIASYGMPVGAEVFETCVWIGRFIQACRGSHSLVYRKDVKLTLCGQPRAKDANIRQALLDRWGGKDEAVGTKAKPGPLYGVKADVWAALGVAVTWAEMQAAKR